MIGAVLAAAIADTVPEEGVLLWWLGQAGVAVRSKSSLFVIDPFLTDYGSFGRLYPPPFQPEDLVGVHAFIATHDHADHIDPDGLPRLLAASPGSALVVPAPAYDRVAGLVGAGRVRAAFVDRPLSFAGATVTPLPALHGETPTGGYGFHLDGGGNYPYLGYVLEVAGVRICHTGDTLVYDGLAERLRAVEPDALFVPINGASWFRERRGLVGNMNVFEAAELSELSGARITVPIHWDLFADNVEDPQHFVRYANQRHPGVTVVIPAIGDPIAVTPH
jgi:L-ascorbate metabolism protein UlaG (beta-lactamase superfamily)